MERLLRPAWAPAAVVALAWLVGRTPLAHDLWWLLHLLGGAALAFFFLRAIDDLRLVHRQARFVGAFAAACTVALGWELAEFTVDQLFGTRLQESQLDTMSDLMFAVCGAAGHLGWKAFSEWRA